MAPMPRVVVCAPAQTPADRHEGRVIVSALREAGFATYWPPDDGLDAAALGAALTDRTTLPTLRRRAALLAERLAGTVDRAVVTRCAGAIVDVNAAVLDARSVYLAATAAMCGVPTVPYRQPAPSVWDAGPGPVLAAIASSWEPVEHIDAIAAALRAATADGPRAPVRPAPGHDTAAGLWMAAHRDEVLDALGALPDLEERLQGPLDETWHTLLADLGAPTTGADDPTVVDLREPLRTSGWGHAGDRPSSRGERGWVRTTPTRTGAPRATTGSPP
jgi:hypothetical protein